MADMNELIIRFDALYFSKRVNRMNDPDGIIPVYSSDYRLIHSLIVD